MSGVVLRDAVLADVAAIAELESLCFPAPWRAEYFDSELRASHRYARVAVDARGRVVGYVFAMYYFDEMHVNKIAVAEELRRHGVAMLLMQECITFALQHEVRTLSLEVRASNEPAQAFYRRLNFAPVYRRRNYYPDGEDAVVMMAGIA